MMVAASFLVLAALASLADCSPTSYGFDRAFRDFLHENDYLGGAVAAIKDGRLLFAKGFGIDRAGNDVTAHSNFHVSSVAKSFTAVAIMRLVQEGRISLTDKVFGRGGILEDIKPWKQDSADPRLNLITVDHLLRHSSGWDVNKGPLYDPVLNKLYLDRGHGVPDIAQEMGTQWPLDPETLTSYVISQPLNFAPGTRTAYSNIAYVVLGRVVEAASRLLYRDYVTKFILEPCGMWRTRLEISAHRIEDHGLFGDIIDNDEQPLYRAIDMVYADSALGWFSTVFDMMRFTRCTFETKQIIDDHHLELLLARPSPNGPDQPDQTIIEKTTDMWYAAGFRTNMHGITWQDGDQHADDLILYHDLRPTKIESKLEASNETKEITTDHQYKSRERIQRDDTAQQSDLGVIEEREGLPESWVILLHGKSINHIRRKSRDLMTLLDTSPMSMPRENIFLYDLCDLHKHPTWTTQRESWTAAEEQSRLVMRAPPDMTLRYHTDEHRLTAYIDALQEESFNVHWFTSYSVQGHPVFVVLGRRVEDPVRSMYDFVFEHNLNIRQLLKNKLWLEERGYNLTQLHSYTHLSNNYKSKIRNKKSSRRKRSHYGLVTRYAAIFRYKAYTEGTQMKYGTGHLPEPYHKLVQMYHEKGFFPVSQTTTWSRKALSKEDTEEISFVFVKRANATKLQAAETVEFQQAHGLTERELTTLTAKATEQQLRLSYLNSYEIKDGEYRFSAVYSNATHARGILETGHTQAKVSERTVSNLMMGVAPKFIVPYYDKEELLYAVYYEEF